MLEKILVANRGEIAVRIIRACKELNIRTVAVYSEADRNSMHTQMADEAICIGQAPASDSYLRVDRLISAAEIADVDAIHPGYGFLSENAHFADVCKSCNIRFIGPSAEAMNALRNKAVSRDLAKKAGVPIPPGSDGPVGTEEEALATTKEIGYPAIIKAVSGGGGRGMRVVHNDISLVKAYHNARGEAEKCFGDSEVYIEKYIENPHHIEIQIIGDSKGKILHLGERDCSIQRRNQKLIEETPSPLLRDKAFRHIRNKASRAAIKICELAKYTNAGTAEFIVDQKGNFYFLEVNKRIQVEHPVTEEVTGQDLVHLQILVACEEPLGISQGDYRPTGHAIECRINAEDPFDNFRPSPGRIEMLFAPGGRGVRFESHAYAGYTISSHYDSMIGKLIAYGKNRAEAMAIMTRALSEFMITGIKTTIPFQLAILQNPDFIRGTYSTSFVENFLRGAGRELLDNRN